MRTNALSDRGFRNTHEADTTSPQIKTSIIHRKVQQSKIHHTEQATCGHLEDSGLPQLGGKVPVRLGEGEVDGLHEVTQGTGVTTGRRVAVFHSGLEKGKRACSTVVAGQNVFELVLGVFSSHLFWTSSSLDVPAGVTQEEGHAGFLIHLPCAVHAFTFIARGIFSRTFPSSTVKSNFVC